MGIMMFGAGNVGKSALTIRFVTDQFLEEYDPTIEDNYRKTVCVDSNEILFDILDAAGREEFSSMHDYWIERAHIICLVFSVVYKESFTDIQQRRERILSVKDMNDWPIIAVGNKCDLRVDGDVNDKGYGGRTGSVVDMDEVYEWCSKHKIPYIETSAKDYRNVGFLFTQCVHEYEAYRKAG